MEHFPKGLVMHYKFLVWAKKNAPQRMSPLKLHNLIQQYKGKSFGHVYYAESWLEGLWTQFRIKNGKVTVNVSINLAPYFNYGIKIKRS